MKKNFVRRTAMFWIAAIFTIGILAGCETCKGMNRDIKSADAWMKDNLW